MYDDKQVEAEDNARLLISEVRRALASGSKHYRKSDNRLLTTDLEIIEAMVEEGGVIYFPKEAE